MGAAEDNAKRMAEYKDTLNLPKTSFPMKANLPLREPEILRGWEEEDLYGKLRPGSAFYV